MKRSSQNYFKQVEIGRMIELMSRLGSENPQLLENLEENLDVVQDQFDEIDRILQRLKRLRQKKNLSLARICARIGIAHESISRLENLRTPNPTVNTLQRYALALGYNLKLKLIPIPQTPKTKKAT